MKIYQINKHTNEIVQEFSNVLSFGNNYVEYLNNNCRGKIYCDTNTEYFSDQIPEQEQ